MIVLIIEELAEKYLFARLLTRRSLLMHTHHLNFQALHLLLVIRSPSSSISNGDSENKVLPLVFEKRMDCLVFHMPVFGKSIG